MAHWKILVSTLPFVALWAVAALLVTNGYWWSRGRFWPWPAAGLLVRMFMAAAAIAVTGGRCSLRRALNDWVGRAPIGVFDLHAL